MAIAPTTSTFCSINGTDYSAWVKATSCSFGAAKLDKTNFASAGWEESIGGIKSGEFSFEAMDDFADNDVNEDFFALLGTVVAVVLRFSSATIGAANPEYRFNVLVTSGTGIDATVGELPMQSHTWPITGAVTRAVA